MTYIYRKFSTHSEMISYANRAKENHEYLLSTNSSPSTFGVGYGVEATFVKFDKNDKDVKLLCEYLKQ